MTIETIDRSSIKLYFDLKSMLQDNPNIENRQEIQALILALKPFILAYSTIDLIENIIETYSPK
jgi:hypothetical protein